MERAKKKASDPKRHKQPHPEWLLIDAQDRILGRLASRIAKILQGKHRVYYTPYKDCGDFVIVINAKKVAVSGKKEEDKIYYRHTGFPGGLKQETLASLRQRRPEEIIRRAVKGMLPKNRLARQMMKKLYIYAGSEHPHKDKKTKVLL